MPRRSAPPLPDPDPDPDPDSAGPTWMAAIAARLDFLERRRPHRRALTATLAALHRRTATPGGCNRALRDFLHACLDLLAESARRRPDLAAIRAPLAELCDLARIALDGDRDDRAVIARARDLMGLPGAAGCAAYVPGRVVWLAAMAAEVPAEEGAAAVMLVNDLAAVDPDLPLRALQVASKG